MTSVVTGERVDTEQFLQQFQRNARGTTCRRQLRVIKYVALEGAVFNGTDVVLMQYHNQIDHLLHYESTLST